MKWFKTAQKIAGKAPLTLDQEMFLKANLSDGQLEDLNKLAAPLKQTVNLDPLNWGDMTTGEIGYAPPEPGPPGPMGPKGEDGKAADPDMVYEAMSSPSVVYSVNWKNILDKLSLTFVKQDNPLFIKKGDYSLMEGKVVSLSDEVTVLKESLEALKENNEFVHGQLEALAKQVFPLVAYHPKIGTSVGDIPFDVGSADTTLAWDGSAMVQAPITTLETKQISIEEAIQALKHHGFMMKGIDFQQHQHEMIELTLEMVLTPGPEGVAKTKELYSAVTGHSHG